VPNSDAARREKQSFGKLRQVEANEIMKNIRHRLEFLVFQIFVCVIDSLSPRATATLARCFANFVHYGLPRKWTRFKVARENIQRAFADRYSEREIDLIVYGMWVHLFRTVAESVQSARKLHLNSYREIVQFADFTRNNEAICSGRRVLMLGGHFGNWEIGTALLGLWGFPMGIVAREMDNPYLHRWFERQRELAGHRLLLKSGNFDEMIEIMQRGGNLGMLCDQDAGPRGVFVDFFGSPASTYKSIALLAIQYDALIMVGYSIRLKDEFDRCRWSRFEVGCEDIIDPRELSSNDPVGEITQKFTAALEHAIRRAPEQYFWIHRRWKSEPRAKPNRKAEQLRKAG
jgi:KDO2-lipid IV(A) lauroyltransferase